MLDLLEELVAVHFELLPLVLAVEESLLSVPLVEFQFGYLDYCQSYLIISHKQILYRLDLCICPLVKRCSSIQPCKSLLLRRYNFEEVIYLPFQQCLEHHFLQGQKLMLHLFLNWRLLLLYRIQDLV